VGTVNAVVVDAGNAELALAAARLGATVVVVGDDADGVGALARSVDDAGGRGLVFLGGPRRAVSEMLAELFPS
jgi:hypothetical protein